MRRRTYLAALAAAGLAGCATGADTSPSRVDAETPTPAPGDTLVAFDRRVNGRQLRFTAGGEETLRAGGSRWERLTGRAVSGAYEGTTLPRANDRSQLFWFAWLDFTPRTTVYRG